MTKPTLDDIKTECHETENGAWESFRVRVGKTTLSKTYSPPWDDIENKANELVKSFLDDPENTPDYGKTLPYWWHRGQIVKENKGAALASFLQEAVALWRFQESQK